MSIATQIQRLQTAKADIKTAIENKGVTIPSNATIDAYPTYVSQITSGGGGSDYEQQLIDLIEKDFTTFNIPDGTTKISDYAFYYCTSLTSVTIPNSVTSISKYAFYNCTSLTSVTIPNSVTSISKYAFYNCTSLTSVTIPNSVISIGTYAFYNCTSLTSVTIPNSVTTIGNNTFYNCKSLTSVTIGSGVNYIGSYTFYDCTSLTSVTINATTPPSLGSNIFSNNGTLQTIYVPAESVELYKSATNWNAYADYIEPISE